MGAQGNYPGSGAINAHKHLAMRGSVPGNTHNMAENDPAPGGEFTEVTAVNTPKGSGSPSEPQHRPGNVRATNTSE
jgi:hypothetical protein